MIPHRSFFFKGRLLPSRLVWSSCRLPCLTEIVGKVYDLEDNGVSDKQLKSLIDLSDHAVSSSVLSETLRLTRIGEAKRKIHVLARNIFFVSFSRSKLCLDYQVRNLVGNFMRWWLFGTVNPSLDDVVMVVYTNLIQTHHL